MIPDICARAIYHVEPDYFSWDEDTQEEWRATRARKKHKKIMKFLLKEGLGKKKKAIKKYTDFQSRKQLKPQDQEQMNLWMLYIQGVGDNYFFLNESMHDDCTELSWRTMRDLDFDDYVFQTLASSDKATALEKINAYHGSMSGNWMRCIENGDLRYVSGTMAWHYICDKLAGAFYGLFKAKVPHDYVTNLDKSKSSLGSVFNIRVEAYGQEKLHRFIETQHRTYLEDIRTQLETYFTADKQGKVYLEDDNHDPNGRDVIFTDDKALEKIRIEHFIQDIHTHKSSDTTLSDLANHHIQDQERWLDAKIAEFHQAQGAEDF